MQTSTVYTTGEIAKFCHVQKMTVVRWVDRGELPAHQLPGRGDRRITHGDLLAFLNRNGFPIPPELATEQRQQTILVIDDDKNVALAITRVLRKSGYRVECAHDGFMAGSLLERVKPALVMLDLAMPGVSGFDVLALIRNREDLKQLKVLVVSALPVERLRDALTAGADGILAKPFENRELVETVGQMLGSIPVRNA